MALWRKPKFEDGPTPSTESRAPSASRNGVFCESQGLRLGSSVHIRGELTGTQDVVLCGTAEGQVKLPDHAFTVGPAAHVAAEVFATRVIVEGHVTGDIAATDIVIVASSGTVRGNVSAPRVVLEDGCTFDGGVNHSDVMRTERATVVQDAEPERAQPNPAEPRKQPEQVEQVWGNGGGAFWTMTDPYDEESGESDRPKGSPRREDGQRKHVSLSILDS